MTTLQSKFLKQFPLFFGPSSALPNSMYTFVSSHFDVVPLSVLISPPKNAYVRWGQWHSYERF